MSLELWGWGMDSLPTTLEMGRCELGPGAVSGHGGQVGHLHDLCVSARALQGGGCAALLSVQVYLTLARTLPSSLGLIGLGQGHAGAGPTQEHSIHGAKPDSFSFLCCFGSVHLLPELGGLH